MKHQPSFTAAWNDEQAERCVKLFRAVIVEALRDREGHIAGGGGRIREGQRRSIIREARDWFEDQGRDYREVCECAGLNPGALAAAVRDGRLHSGLFRAGPLRPFPAEKSDA